MVVPTSGGISAALCISAGLICHMFLSNMLFQVQLVDKLFAICVAFDAVGIIIPTNFSRGRWPGSTALCHLHPKYSTA